jgi:hypothetical protein
LLIGPPAVADGVNAVGGNAIEANGGANAEKWDVDEDVGVGAAAAAVATAAEGLGLNGEWGTGATTGVALPAKLDDTGPRINGRPVVPGDGGICVAIRTCSA